MKLTKTILKKIITKKKQKQNEKKKAHVRKNNVEKYCNNSQCFVRKATVLSPHHLAFLIILSHRVKKERT